MPWPNSKQFQAPQSTSKHLMTTCTWHVTSWLPWPWHERLTIDEHDAPSRPDQSIRSKPGRSDRSDLWLGMAWHGLAQTDTSAVWSCLIPFVHLILQVLCFQWRSCLSYFQTLCSWFYCEFGITLAYHTMRPFSVACFYICYQIKGRFSHFVFITKTGKV